MASKGKELMKAPSEEALALLRQQYPSEPTFQRALLPRLGLITQDVTEGKGKTMKVTAEAGTFFTEVQTEEEDAEGKKVWDRTEIGTETEGIILFKRKQLKYYDKDTEQYTSSPVYDNDDEILPLFCDKKEIARGTPAELKKLYPGVSQKGKPISKLEDNRILYVLFQGEKDEESKIYQVNLRGTSMYSFMTYERKASPASAYLTKFSSEPQENGSTAWNMMTFEMVRALSADEVDTVLEKVGEIKSGIEQEKAYFASIAGPEDESRKQADEDFKKF